LIAFILAIPISLFGSLGGGLLGEMGILAYGLIPFVIFLPIARLRMKLRVAAVAVLVALAVGLYTLFRILIETL